MTIKGS